MGMFIRITRSVVDSFKNAYQLFADVWSPIAEAGINLGGSILLGYLWGLNGILLGSNLSLVLIVLVWKPYYTFRYGLKSPVRLYFMQYILHLAILLGCAWIIRTELMNLAMEKGIYLQMTILSIALLAYIVSTGFLFYISTSGMRSFTLRIIKIITHKL
jgi:hypothetical protein